MLIRITKTPPGSADEHIREAWVGVEMHAEPDKGDLKGWSGNENVGGYNVSGIDAVNALLATGKTEAAQFWNNPVPPHSLRFGAEYCEVISQ